MRFHKSISIVVLFWASLAAAFPKPALHPFRLWQGPDDRSDGTSNGDYSVSANHNVSLQLFAELEEFARIVDIAYCVGLTGIHPPFECASRCDEFPGYELVDTWNTGPLMSDSCGYIALDHDGKRVIVAFRGTYSITNTIVDLTTIPQEYVPYPGDPDDDPKQLPHGPVDDLVSRPWRWLRKFKHRFSPLSLGGVGGYADTTEKNGRPEGPKCTNCTVHMGFFSSWKNTRPIVLPHLQHLHKFHPTYSLHLVGHSLGGAVAALAGLETEVLGWNPTVTTFGEPRVGNRGLRDYLDKLFELDSDGDGEREKMSGRKATNGARYRRMTHFNDPVPLLPLTEWGYKMHAGEIYISKPDLQPTVGDLRLCDGNEDVECIFGGEAEAPFVPEPDDGVQTDMETVLHTRWGLPARYRMWQLFFAHRDYFWRLGLCVPGGDPADWGRRYGNHIDGKELDES